MKIRKISDIAEANENGSSLSNSSQVTIFPYGNHNWKLSCVSNLKIFCHFMIFVIKFFLWLWCKHCYHVHCMLFLRLALRFKNSVTVQASCLPITKSTTVVSAICGVWIQNTLWIMQTFWPNTVSKNARNILMNCKLNSISDYIAWFCQGFETIFEYWKSSILRSRNIEN